MDKKMTGKRVGAIRRLLKGKGVDCLILTKAVNVTYVTGFTGEDSWAVITGRGVWLVTDSRYTEQAEGECAGCKIIERAGPIAAALGKFVGRFKSVGAVAVEKSASVAVVEELRKNLKGRVRTVGGVVEAVRGIKDASEIACVRVGIRIADEALKKVRRRFKAGVSENELAGALDFEIRKLGGRNSFDTIVAFGANASRAHHQPGGKKLKVNDTILIDYGARYKGYCCDVTRCFTVGKVSGFYLKVYEAVKEAQAAAIKIVRAGARIEVVDSAARDVIAGYDLPVYGHGTGHGLGLEVHEGPVVARERKGTLKAGELITIEPGVYIPGKLGVRIEDDVLVTETGCKVLSSAIEK